MSKDNGKKTEAPAASNGGTAIVPATGAKTGLPVYTLQDLDRLESIAVDKLSGLGALLTDTTLEPSVKAKIQGLIDQANPIKPGMEEVQTRWTVQRISQVQPTTQAIAKPEAAKPGDIFTSAGQLLERPFAFIPIYFNYENIMFKQGEKAPECSSPDAKLGSPYGLCVSCPHLPYGKQNGGRGEQKKTNCQNQIVVAVLAADLSQVYIIQFAKTSRGAGSGLMTLAAAQPFPWKQSYLLTTYKEVGDLGTYYIYKIEPTGKDNSPEAMKVAKVLNELYEANRKKFLGEFYYRTSNGAQTVAAAEENFNGTRLDAGLDLGRKGEEPDLSGTSPAPGPSVRSGKPM